jgi:UDPglucose 6-dehydrogenase
MKVIVLGTGFVGLTHAAILAERRLEVVAVDIDAEKIAACASGEAEQIERYVNEPGLSACVRDGLNSGSLRFSTDVQPHLDSADAIFLCLPTPAVTTGATNLSFYRSAIRELVKAIALRPRSRRLVLINKSTVPIGTARSLANRLRAAGVREVGVVSNPEFLPQGDAVDASRRPSRIVVGANHPEDFEVLRRIYAPYVEHVRIRYVETTPETAEAIKYVSNALLFTYVSFWNGVAARLAETIDTVQMNDLRLGVTTDSRLSAWGSYVGNGAGGSCFGKDIRSLAHQMEALGLRAELLREVLAINETQKVYLVDRAEEELGFSFEGKSVALLGLSFKKNTNDLRDSAALSVIEALLARGVRSIRAYDPIVTEAAARKHLDCEKNPLFERVSYFTSAEDAIRGSDALFISNDSEEFRELAEVIRRSVAPPYTVIDGRCMLPDSPQLIAAGYDYLCVGDQARKNSGEGKAGKDACAA